jgi:cellulose biosynthesis protein BcsQ
MSKQSLIIAVKEAEYIDRLAEYIRHSPFGEIWQLTAFTNPAALKHFIRGGYRIDFIVAQPAMLEGLSESIGSIPAAALVSYYGQCQDIPEVMQYQPLPQLLQSFSAVYAASGERFNHAVSNGNGSASVVSVYSASGGIGKTTLALQLAQQAGLSGLRVFYLNLEQWNATSLWFGEEGGDDFSQMLYTLQTLPDKAFVRLTELRKRHSAMKFDYLSPCRNAEERLSLTAEHVKQLLSAIIGTSQYDLIVVDLDSRLEPLHYEIFAASDHTLWLVSDQAVVRRKTEIALQYGEQKWGQAFIELKRSIRFIQIQSEQGDQQELEGKLNLRIDGILPYVTEWANGRQPVDFNSSAAYLGAVEVLFGRFFMLEKGANDARGSCAATKG